MANSAAGPAIALLEGRPTLIGTATATGLVGSPFSYQSVLGRHELALFGVYPSGTTATTLTVNLQVSVDGVNFAPLGTALTLSSIAGTLTAGQASVDLAGYEGCILQVSVATITLGSGVTAAQIWANLG